MGSPLGSRSNLLSSHYVMMREKRTVITVDGLAGSGKTTLSREFAGKIGFLHLNSGLLYRAAAAAINSAKIVPTSQADVEGFLKGHSFGLRLIAGGVAEVTMDDVAVSGDLQRPEISETASLISQFKGVRDALRDAQRDAFPGKPLVAEGRDMGTVIFPDADLKLFVEVDQVIRVKRRLSQLGVQSGDKDVEATIRQEIIERDIRDAERAIAPTKPAADAVIIDNSSRSLTEVLDAMYDAALERGLIA